METVMDAFITKLREIAKSRNPGRGNPERGWYVRECEPTSPDVLDAGCWLTADEIEFGKAMVEWRKVNGRYPTWADALEVAKCLGYRKQ